MRTLSLLTLAAGAALVPAAALAQPAPRAGVHVQGPNVQMRHPGVRPGPGFRPGRHFRPGPGFRPGHGFQRRLHRGFVVPHFFFGPQFHVQNWQLYGFAQPGADQRWVRYYDDAYLIDRGGRIVDTREGLDWDQYGERWEVEDGLPSYYGRNEYHPGEGDYAWAEEHRGRDGDGEHHVRREHHAEGGWDYSGYGHAGAGGHGYAYGQAMAPGVAVYGGGYGYGYYAYPIIIETTTTSASSSYIVEEIVEEVVETRRPRARRARCNCPPPRRRPAPRPAPRPRAPAGERG